MPTSKTTFTASFVDSLKELYGYGFLLEPQTSRLVPYERWKRLWRSEDSCAFRLVPVTDEARGVADSNPSLVRGSVTAAYALRRVRELAEPGRYDEAAFVEAVEKAYPGEDFSGKSRKPLMQNNLRGIGDFRELAVA